MKEWLSTKDEIGNPVAREFIKRVRVVLVEKGIPLDHGNRDFKRVGEIKTKEVSQTNPLVLGNQTQTDVKVGDGQMDGYTDTDRMDRYTDAEVKVVHHSTRSSKERFQPRDRYQSDVGKSRKVSCLHVSVWDTSLELVREDIVSDVESKVTIVVTVTQRCISPANPCTNVVAGLMKLEW